MDNPETATEAIGWLIGFCAGAVVLGGIAMGIAAYFLKKHLNTLKENAKLKDQAIIAKIEKVETALKLEMTTLRGDFKELRAEVRGGLAEMERVNTSSVKKYEDVTISIRKTQERAEVRFETFQKRLEEVHVWVDRLKASVAKRGG